MDKRIGAGLFLWLLLGVTTTGCTATIDADKSKLGPRPVGCTVGTEIACTCPDQSASRQKCNGYGRYDPCACGSLGTAGIGG